MNMCVMGLLYVCECMSMSVCVYATRVHVCVSMCMSVSCVSVSVCVCVHIIYVTLWLCMRAWGVYSVMLSLTDPQSMWPPVTGTLAPYEHPFNHPMNQMPQQSNPPPAYHHCKFVLCVRVCVYACVCACVHVCIHMYVCVDVWRVCYESTCVRTCVSICWLESFPHCMRKWWDVVNRMFACSDEI